MEEAAEEEGKEVDDDENEVEKQAVEEAMVEFERYYKQLAISSKSCRDII
jgi:hypothetical protein